MNFNIFQWRSLKTRVTVFTLAIFLISLWSLAFYASQALRNDVQSLLSEQQLSTVSFIAAEVNQALNDQFNVLEKVAGRVSLAMLGHPATLQAFLEERLTLQGPFNGGIFVTQVDGVAIAGLPRSAEWVGVNDLDRDYIVSALKGKATVGRPVMSRVLQAPVFVMAAPIRDLQGAVIGALAGVTNLSQPNFLDRLTHGRYGQSGGYVLISPQHRLVVTASDKSRIMQTLPTPGVNPGIDRFLDGYEGSAMVVNPLGVEVLASGKSVPATGWIAVAALPTAEAFAPIHAMQERMWITTVFLTLLAGGLTWWMLRRQLSPMLAAVRTLAAWSDTHQPPQPLPMTRQDEIGELIGGFNRLLSTLAQRENALIESERLLKESQLIANLGDYVLDIPSKVWKSSSMLDQLFGIDAAYERSVAGWAALIHPDDRALIVDYFNHQVLGQGHNFNKKYRIIRADNQAERWVHGLGKLEFDAQGRPVKMQGVILDITAYKRVEESLREREEWFRKLFEDHSAIMLVIDPDTGNIVDANQAAANFYGWSIKKLKQMDIDQVNTLSPATMKSEIQEVISARKTCFTFRHRRADGSIRDVEVFSNKIKINHKPLIYCIIHDITERRQMEEHIRQLALYDPLTQLPNRRLLNDRLNQTMITSKRSGCHVALMFLDLDHFKPLNDTHGHAVGDLLLIEVANRLKSCIRGMDTIARFGGDEFVVMLSELNVNKAQSMSQAEVVAEKIRFALSEPYWLTVKRDGQTDNTVEHHCTASIGIVVFMNHQGSLDDVLKWADQTMYQAKEAGRNRIRFYDMD
jgi:diguanylate cyclase (GGDEF)-like protein/PAS domain S-box-containing protein